MNVVARLARSAWALPPHAVQAHAAVQAATGTRTRRHPFLGPTQCAGREAVIPPQCYLSQVCRPSFGVASSIHTHLPTRVHPFHQCFPLIDGARGSISPHHHHPLLPTTTTLALSV